MDLGSIHIPTLVAAVVIALVALFLLKKVFK